MLPCFVKRMECFENPVACLKKASDLVTRRAAMAKQSKLTEEPCMTDFSMYHQPNVSTSHHASLCACPEAQSTMLLLLKFLTDKESK